MRYWDCASLLSVKIGDSYSYSCKDIFCLNSEVCRYIEAWLVTKIAGFPVSFHIFPIIWCNCAMTGTWAVHHGNVTAIKLWAVIGQLTAQGAVRAPRTSETMARTTQPSLGDWSRWGRAPLATARLRGAEKSEKTEQIRHQCLSGAQFFVSKHSNGRI